jgi:hypothetical protein
MKHVLSLTSKVAGAALVAGLSVASFTQSASAFSFSTGNLLVNSEETAPGPLPLQVNYTNNLSALVTDPNYRQAGPLANAAAPPAPGGTPIPDTQEYFVVGRGDRFAFTNPISDAYTISFAPGFSVLSFVWGSVDEENTLELFDTLGASLGLISGADVAKPAAGDQLAPFDNPWVTIASNREIGSATFRTTKIAFETSNFSTAVPEPTTMVGLAIAGGAGLWMKRRQKQQSASQA